LGSEAKSSLMDLHFLDGLEPIQVYEWALVVIATIVAAVHIQQRVGTASVSAVVLVFFLTSVPEKAASNRPIRRPSAWSYSLAGPEM